MLNDRAEKIKVRNFGFDEGQVATYAFKLTENGTYRDLEPALAKLKEKYTVLFNRPIEDGINGAPVQAIIFTGNTENLSLHLSKGEFINGNDMNSIVIGKKLYEEIGNPSEVIVGSKKLKIKGVCDNMYLTTVLLLENSIKDYFIETPTFSNEYMTIKIIKDSSSLTKDERLLIYSTLREVKNSDKCFEFFGSTSGNTLSSALYEMEDKVNLNSIVLIVGSFNILVVSTFWILDRKKEICIRKAFGAEKKHIILLIYKELSILMLFSIVISLLLQLLFITPLSSLLKINLSISPLYLIMLFIMAFILIFLASIFPVIRSLRMEISQCLKE